MASKLDVESLRALKAIADNGGVTKAAHHLSLSQSAVSHKIKRLEDHINSTLLSRRAGGPLLTEAGERLLGYANRILILHDEALGSLDKRPLVGSIRLGMTEDMSSSGLARILARFSRVFPNVTVRTHVAQSMILQNEVEEGAIDIGVMQIFVQDQLPNDIRLFSNRLLWAKARDFEMSGDGPIPFLAYDDHCFYKEWLLEHTSQMNRQFKTVLECASNAGIVAGIEAGLGVSIINEKHLTDGMDVLGPEFHAPPDIAYIIRTSSKTTSNAVSALAGEIADEAGNTSHLQVA